MDFNVLLKIMNLRVMVLLSMVVLLVSSCKDNDDSQNNITIDVYSPQKTRSVKMDGDYLTDPLDLYLDDVFIGTTPFVFTKSKLESLNLPVDERIDVSQAEHWNTWDTSGHGTFLISSRDRSVQRKLELRTRNRDEPKTIYFKGLAKEGNPEGGVIWFAGIPKPQNAEQGVPAKSDRAGR